jgi:Fe-S oxidoreductase
LARGVMTGHLPPETFGRDEFKQIADLCVNCHQCRLECPTGVDIPKLMLEAKAAYIRDNGLRPTEWFLAHIDRISQLASRFPHVANWIIANRQMRWLLEKIVGIAQGRKLPRLATRGFLRVAHRRRLTRPTRRTGPKVLYFVDTYANYHDAQLADALVRVFEHNGVAVYVHPDQKASGMAMLAQGATEQAKAVAARNIALLAEAVRQGYQIVASEPSAVLALTHEYPQLIDDDEARLVAANTSEACHYLWTLHRQGKLQLDFKPLAASLAYHTPCHLKALGVGSPGENLLRLIPGLSLNHVEAGCSGMAGTFGLGRRNYRNSLRAGRKLIAALRAAPVQAGATECSACKMQMEQGAGKPTIHPLKVLALAYGLMPDAASLLTAPSEDLVVT